ncbi:MAG: LLM class flavin-dependent oxidoreductase [Chloroflexi bacterium]|nr:LLM class flavin-dependent oxidoreductase [Chloroflexota bacterium]
MTAVRFGIFDHLERRADVPLAQQYEERLQFLEQADRAGVDGYHVAEHHHSPLCLAPNQVVYLSAVAQRTRRIRLGSLVHVLPLHHPIRLIEEICMLDQLSGGRVDVGVGAGTGGGTEFAMWGGDAAENAARFRETLDILRRGLCTDFLSFEGEYFRFEDVWMELRPLQQPHPPFWYAGNAERAAELGMHFIGAGRIDRLPELRARFDAIWTRELESGSDAHAAAGAPWFGTMKHTFIAETDEEAVARAHTAYAAYGTHFAKPLPPGEMPTAWQPPERTGRAPGEAPFDRYLGGEALIAGSPRTVREYVERWVERSECNYWVSSFQWGDLTHDEASRSLAIFADEVMPAVR